MTTKAYQVEGDFQMGRVRQHFVLQIPAASEAAAKERVFAQLGSRHGVNRRQITITGAKSIAEGEVTDPVTSRALGIHK